MTKWYQIPAEGTALIRKGGSRTKVTFTTGLFVLPFIHQAQIVNISMIPIKLNFEPDKGIFTRDDEFVGVDAIIYVQVMNTHLDVLSAVRNYGIERLNNEELLTNLLVPQLKDVLATVFKHFDTNFLCDPYNKLQIKEKVLSVCEITLDKGIFADDIIIEVRTRPNFLNQQNHIF